ncbi:MAG: hypothetical protein ACAH59_14400, partial [Pseudobdellovibrionaceae bacterium]
NGRIEGSIEVPNTFTSPLDGNAFCSYRDSSCHFSFDIVAHENGQDYTVHYDGRILREDYAKIKMGLQDSTIKGQATLENGQILGEFVAIKKAEL